MNPTSSSRESGLSGSATPLVKPATPKSFASVACRPLTRAAIAAPAGLVVVGTNGDAVAGSASSPNRSARRVVPASRVAWACALSAGLASNSPAARRPPSEASEASSSWKKPASCSAPGFAPALAAAGSSWMALWTRARTSGIRPNTVIDRVSPSASPRVPRPTSASASVVSAPRLSRRSGTPVIRPIRASASARDGKRSLPAAGLERSAPSGWREPSSQRWSQVSSAPSRSTRSTPAGTPTGASCARSPRGASRQARIASRRTQSPTVPPERSRRPCP